MGFLTASKIYDFHPKHPMKLTHVDQPFECDGCYEMGFGYCYQCNEPDTCGSIYHEECTKPQGAISHSFSSGCKFTFSRPDKINVASAPSPQYSTTRTVYKICKACGTEVKGNLYVCEEHGHFIHPSCMTLANQIDISGCKLVLNKTLKEKCAMCGHKSAFQGIKGWSYRSLDGNLCLHIKCVKKMYMDEWKKVNIAGTSNSNASSSSSSTPLVITLDPPTAFLGITSDRLTENSPLVIHGQSNFKGKLKMACKAIALNLFGKSTSTMAPEVMKAITNN